MEHRTGESTPETHPKLEPAQESGLSPSPSDARTAALVVYSHERFLAAMRGELAMEDYARETREHVVRQLPGHTDKGITV